MSGLETAEDEIEDEGANEIQDENGDENEIQDESVTTPDVMMRPQTSSFNQLRTQHQSDIKVVLNKYKQIGLCWPSLCVRDSMTVLQAVDTSKSLAIMVGALLACYLPLIGKNNFKLLVFIKTNHHFFASKVALLRARQLQLVYSKSGNMQSHKIGKQWRSVNNEYWIVSTAKL